MNNYAEMFLELTNRMQLLLSERDFSQKACIQTGKMECTLLQYLHHVKKPVSMNELAKELNVSHSRITRIMDNLVIKRFVIRQHSDNDRRCWYAVITPDGTRLAEYSQQSILQQQVVVLEGLRNENIEEIYKAMEKYVRAYERLLEDGGYKFDENKN